MKKPTITAPAKPAKRSLTMDEMQKVGKAIADSRKKAKVAASAASAKKKGKPLAMK